ncbi:SMP-30/gluconolactonase/LRE family protein [Dactylosporangium sp. NPDC049140]|uniref:SMP-30/gluconolactonase/LRE family protein n=1 Tax=Dactylosporangium sp. NPDC049140 TaxID=3155647 RepID=UPI0033F5B7D7
MTDLFPPDAVLEHLFTGATWGEGPVWLPALRRLRWSDIPGNRILEYDEASGATHVLRTDAEYPNGRTLDRQGRVVQCSHGRRAIERESDDGPQTLVDRWARGRFNSPNDVVVARDRTIWFTDPPYGIHESGREGHPGRPEYDGCFVFRFDEASGTVDPVITDMVHPNGLAFSPDESVLYVADTGYLQVPGAPRGIRAYDVVDGARCTGGRDLVEVRPGATDGMRVDAEGRIWSSSADSVQVFSSTGERLAAIPVPEKVSNLCFGGGDGRTLYITASTSLYRIRTATTDAQCAGR